MARAATCRPVPSSPRISTPARMPAARAISAMTSRIAIEWPYRSSPFSSDAGMLSRASYFSSRSIALATRRPPSGLREHVRHPCQHRLRRQVGAPRVDHGEHQRGGPLGADFTRDLERRCTLREVEQHRHVAPLQLGEGEGRIFTPHHRDVDVAELFFRIRALRRGTAEIEDRGHFEFTATNWPVPFGSTSRRAMPLAP